jgi:hypothetical protein
MARSLADRLRAHEQQKARLADQEAKLRAAERKARTRQLIQAGGLIDNACLLELEPNALYGELLSLKDGAADKEQIGQWAALGGRALAREDRLAEEGKEAIMLAFPAPLHRDATTALRASGFRFNKLLQHWEERPRGWRAPSFAFTKSKVRQSWRICTNLYQAGRLVNEACAMSQRLTSQEPRSVRFMAR